MSAAYPPPSTVLQKRDGRSEPFDRRKVENNLRALSWGLDTEFIAVDEVVDNLEMRLPQDVMSTETFQIFLAETVSTFSARHPDYSTLAGRIYVGYIHKRVPKRFSTWVTSLDESSPSLFAPGFLDVVRANADLIDSAIVHYRDFEFTYHAMQTFDRSFLLQSGSDVNERLQFLYMRVAIGIYGDDIARVLETYDLLSTKKMSFASPILWNGGLAKQHFASCYIFEPFVAEAKDAVSNIAGLSALWAADGGIGIHAGDVPATRAAGRGDHPGLMPLLRVYESLAGYWSRSSAHRSSSATVYVPIWHADVRKFVVSRTNRASTTYRFRHLFPALWIPDLFMQRLEADKSWSLFDPADVQPLTDLVGGAFATAYEAYERDGLALASIPARTLWDTISGALRESGCPFLLFSDNINHRNNQMHLGIIKASNLCTEIVQYTSAIESAVCTLGALCLPSFVREDGTFDYLGLHRVAKILVRNLDRLIDKGSYPTADSAVSAYGTRSLGIGAQGLADVFAKMGYAYASAEARDMNVRIAETIYHGALESSCELAERFGPYDKWEGSPASRRVLQLDMWDAEPTDRYDFDLLRDRIESHGLRNSMLTAQMPTATTAHLLGNSEGIEPYTSNIVQYRVLSGTFNELSRHLVDALRKRGVWSEQIRSDILAAHGSVQNIDGIPDDLKAVFRTAFEQDPHDLIDMVADRAPFIDQSQSFSLFVAQPTPEILMDLELHAWKAGLKTGAYYVRSKPPSEPQQYGLPLSCVPAMSSVVMSFLSVAFALLALFLACAVYSVLSS